MSRRLRQFIFNVGAIWGVGGLSERWHNPFLSVWTMWDRGEVKHMQIKDSKGHAACLYGLWTILDALQCIIEELRQAQLL